MMNVYVTQGKCRDITMVNRANTSSICYLSYWNEQTTCCIKLHTLNVIHSLYFWHIHYPPSSYGALIIDLIEMDKTAGKMKQQLSENFCSSHELYNEAFTDSFMSKSYIPILSNHRAQSKTKFGILSLLCATQL